MSSDAISVVDHGEFGTEHEHKCGTKLPRGQTGCGTWYLHRHKLTGRPGESTEPRPTHGERPGQCPNRGCLQYRADNPLPTQVKVIHTKRGRRAGAIIQGKRASVSSREEVESDRKQEDASSDFDKARESLLYWVQQRAYGRNRTANLRAGLFNQALSYLRDNYEHLSVRDHTRLVGPIIDLAMQESPEERYFADAMNVPGAAASMIRASLAATKGELESTRPAGLARATGAMVLSTCGTMLSGALGYAASKTFGGIIPKILVGVTVAGIGTVMANVTAAKLLEPVKVKVTLPGM